MFDGKNFYVLTNCYFLCFAVKSAVIQPLLLLFYIKFLLIYEIHKKNAKQTFIERTEAVK